MKKLTLLSFIFAITCNAQVFSMEDFTEQNTELKNYVKSQIEKEWFNIREQLDNIQTEMVNKYAKILKENYEKNRTKYKFNNNIFNTKKYKDIVEDEINDIVFKMVVNQERAEAYTKRYHRRFVDN